VGETPIFLCFFSYFSYFFPFFISLAYNMHFRTTFRYVVRKYGTRDHSVIGAVRLS
jgi:hypothetical protein